MGYFGEDGEDGQPIRGVPLKDDDGHVILPDLDDFKYRRVNEEWYSNKITALAEFEKRVDDEMEELSVSDGERRRHETGALRVVTWNVAQRIRNIDALPHDLHLIALQEVVWKSATVGLAAECGWPDTPRNSVHHVRRTEWVLVCRPGCCARN